MCAIFSSGLVYFALLHAGAESNQLLHHVGAEAPRSAMLSLFIASFSSLSLAWKQHQPSFPPTFIYTHMQLCEGGNDVVQHSCVF